MNLKVLRRSLEAVQVDDLKAMSTKQLADLSNAAFELSGEIETILEERLGSTTLVLPATALNL